MKPTIQIDNNLSLIKDASQYTCSILVGRNYLSYALSDKDCSVIYLLKHYYFEDKVIGKNDFNEILRDPVFKNVNNVKIAIDSLKSTLVPDILFDETHKQDYFALVHDLTAEENIHTQKLSGGKTSVFSLKKSTVSFLGSIYKNVTFYDASSCLLNTYPGILTGEEIQTFFLCIKDDCVTMSVFQNKELILHQVYSDTSVSDITYYISNYISAKSIPKENTRILIHGESVRVTNVYNELVLYYPDVKYCSRIQKLQYPESLFAQPSHYFFNLFSLVTCA